MASLIKISPSLQPAIQISSAWPSLRAGNYFSTMLCNVYSIIKTTQTLWKSVRIYNSLTD